MNTSLESSTLIAHHLHHPKQKILVHDRPEKRAIYAPHESDGWHICRELIHYRCFKCYMASTKTERSSEIVDFLPHHSDTLKTSSADSAAITASQLIYALEKPTPTSPSKVEEPAISTIKNYQKFSNVQCNHCILNSHTKVINF